MKCLLKSSPGRFWAPYASWKAQVIRDTGQQKLSCVHLPSLTLWGLGEHAEGCQHGAAQRSSILAHRCINGHMLWRQLLQTVSSTAGKKRAEYQKKSHIYLFLPCLQNSLQNLRGNIEDGKGRRVGWSVICPQCCWRACMCVSVHMCENVPSSGFLKGNWACICYLKAI